MNPIWASRVAQLVLLALAAFPQIARSDSPPQAPAPSGQGKSSPERLTVDTLRTTPSGATFTAPAEWSIETRSDLVVLTAPEADTHLAIFDSQAADARTAVAAAWAAYKPESTRPIRLVTPLPAREGWDERQVTSYETSPNERLVVEAIAMRAATTWTVFIVDASEPTLEKRAAQIELLLESLRPKGYRRESFAGRKALPLTPERIEALKTFVETSMKTLGVPGASLALIDNGKVVYEGGFGVRELGKPTPVDANTLFMAASNTKGMTTLLLAQLVDAQKLKWNEPVTEAYPSFKLGGADTTRQVQIKHLVCACTGLPRQDFEWLFQFKSFTPASTFTLLGNMQPTSRFGEVFQYSNLMAAAAGYIGAHLYDPSAELGAAYDEAMQKQIFTPLGMMHTTFDMQRAQHGNFASPHGDDVDGHPAVASMDNNYSIVPFRPAGGVWTSAHDLARYAMLELSRGKLPDGEQLVSKENLLMRRKPQIATGEDETYGMGLETTTRWGVPVIHHGGSMFGYKSDWMILPDSGIGAVLLTNADNGGMLLGPMMRRLLEVVFDGKPEAVGDVDSAAATHRAVLAKERERLVVPASKDEVSKLADLYRSTALGELKVEHQGADTVFQFSGWKSTVASRKNDDGTMSFITIDPTVRGFEFVEAERNNQRALIIRDAQHEYVFLEVH
jgi:CubicO group peptidase (beta-lactamase class C family)